MKYIIIKALFQHEYIYQLQTQKSAGLSRDHVACQSSGPGSPQTPLRPPFLGLQAWSGPELSVLQNCKKGQVIDMFDYC